MKEAFTFNYIDKIECTGCEACTNVCPVGAMKMKQDESGFFYPNTDCMKCIECGRCVSVCHRAQDMHHENKINEIQTYAGYAKKDKVVYESSSGGLFRTLADGFMKLHPNGQVCAVIWDEDFKGVHHEFGGNELLEQMQRSKYVQSRKNAVYTKVRDYLENGCPILFVGCPCEVAALSFFLGKEYDNLYKIDFVCQGPTAPSVLKSYVENLERKYRSVVHYINLRLPAGKNWIPQWSDIRFENKKRYVRAFYETDLGIAVHYMQREACFSCEIRGKNRFSDMTLGDFHGVSPQAAYYNAKGTSILCINTVKGEKLLKFVEKQVNLEPVDYSMVEKYNKRMTEPRLKEEEDSLFISTYKEEGLKNAIKKTLPWKKKIKYYLPTALSNKLNGYKGCEKNEE